MSHQEDSCHRFSNFSPFDNFPSVTFPCLGCGGSGMSGVMRLTLCGVGSHQDGPRENAPFYLSQARL